MTRATAVGAATTAINTRRFTSLVSLFIVLVSPSVGFVSFSRQVRASIPLPAKNNEGEDPPPVSPFESMVRNVTGMSDYKFGDLTKEAISATTHAVEDVAKKTHLVDDDFKFGDITKGAITTISKPVESALMGAERTLSLVRDADIHELVALSNVVWKENLNEQQRKETWIIMIHLAAIAVLAYKFISNLQAGMVTAVAWTRTSMLTGASPLSNWQTFLQIQQTLNMFFGGPFLPARAIVTIKFFFPYRRLVVGVQRRSPLRTKYPLLSRVVSVLGMWLVVNLFAVGLATGAMVWLSSLWTGIPVLSSS